MSANENKQELGKNRFMGISKDDIPTYRELAKRSEKMLSELKEFTAEVLRDHDQLIQITGRLTGPNSSFWILGNKLDEVKVTLQKLEERGLLHEELNKARFDQLVKTLKGITALPGFYQLGTNFQAIRDLLELKDEEATGRFQKFEKGPTACQGKAAFQALAEDIMKKLGSFEDIFVERLSLLTLNTCGTENNVQALKEKLTSFITNMEEKSAAIDGKFAPLSLIANIEAEAAVSRGLHETSIRNSTQLVKEGRYLYTKVTEIDQRQARIEHLAEYSSISLSETEQRILARVDTLEQKLDSLTQTPSASPTKASVEFPSKQDVGLRAHGRRDWFSEKEIVEREVVEDSDPRGVLPTHHGRLTFAEAAMKLALGCLVSMIWWLMVSLFGLGWDLVTAMQFWVAANVGWLFLPFARTTWIWCVFGGGYFESHSTRPRYGMQG